MLCDFIRRIQTNIVYSRKGDAIADLHQDTAAEHCSYIKQQNHPFMGGFALTKYFCSPTPKRLEAFALRLSNRYF